MQFAAALQAVPTAHPPSWCMQPSRAQLNNSSEVERISLCKPGQQPVAPWPPCPPGWGPESRPCCAQCSTCLREAREDATSFMINAGSIQSQAMQNGVLSPDLCARSTAGPSKCCAPSSSRPCCVAPSTQPLLSPQALTPVRAALLGRKPGGEDAGAAGGAHALWGQGKEMAAAESSHTAAAQTGMPHGRRKAISLAAGHDSPTALTHSSAFGSALRPQIAGSACPQTRMPLLAYATAKPQAERGPAHASPHSHLQHAVHGPPRAEPDEGGGEAKGHVEHGGGHQAARKQHGGGGAGAQHARHKLAAQDQMLERASDVRARPSSQGICSRGGLHACVCNVLDSMLTPHNMGWACHEPNCMAHCSREPNCTPQHQPHLKP